MNGREMAKVSYKFDPFKLTGISKPVGASKKEILKEIADFTLDKTLELVSETNSPVQGHGKFKRLKKKYAKQKSAQGGVPIPNLELKGDMLTALKAPVRDDKIEIGVFKGSEALKADNHNKVSAKSKKTPVPMRRFIPSSKEKETFKKPIVDGMKRIIRSFEK